MVAMVRQKDKSGFSSQLLDWYDEHARALPWRISPGQRRAGQKADPYRVWLSEVMLQQTTVATVRPRFQEFLSRWPTVQALAAAPLEEVLSVWAGLGYYARARNLHGCAKAIVTDHGGRFPPTEKELLRLPGIGAYTAAAIAAIAFDQTAVVVDGNVERVLIRQFAISQPKADAKKLIYQYAQDLRPRARPGDYAQAMMDLGATVCRPGRPACEACPVASGCTAHARGTAADLPVRPIKKTRPTRFGTVFVGIASDNRVLVERRPATGLYGGMSGLPGTEWRSEPPAALPPFRAQWKEGGEISHTLTHFHLRLVVRYARVRTEKPGLFWEADMSALPTVFRKAVSAAAATCSVGG
ncbi:MAG: A/G-specific adenine glycosylase [Parvularcula sp.]